MFLEVLLILLKEVKGLGKKKVKGSREWLQRKTLKSFLLIMYQSLPVRIANINVGSIERTTT